MSNKLVTCPYDEVHRMKESRLAMHITKCRLNHPLAEKFTCSFNASHIYPIQEKSYHLLNCPDRAVIDRALAFKALDQNNPFRGNTAVPSYTASLPTHCDEIWDDGLDLMEPAPGYVPAGPPPSAIIEPPALSKPAERRKLYQELHKRPLEPENCNPKPTQEVQHRPQVIRQPKALSQVESKTSTEYSHLGFGRGRPAAAATATSRIAANIFTPIPSQAASINYSTALSGMSNLGLGRGYSGIPSKDTSIDDEFPALGCGRGMSRTKKNDIRYPNSGN